MKQLALLLTWPLFALSCDDELLVTEMVDFNAVAIIWTGEYEKDGCGFFVEIDSVRHKPVNEDFFTAAYQVAGDTSVEMKYRNLNKEIMSQCGEGPPFKINGIEVLDIR